MAGLKLPIRLTILHDYMSNKHLKRLLTIKRFFDEKPMRPFPSNENDTLGVRGRQSPELELWYTSMWRMRRDTTKLRKPLLSTKCGRAITTNLFVCPHSNV